jgi:hypothetical protein
VSASGRRRTAAPTGHRLAGAHELRLHAALQLARADAHEGDAVAVVGVHVRLDLEDEAGHLGSVACTLRVSATWSRGGGAIGASAFDQVAHAEIRSAEPK